MSSSAAGKQREAAQREEGAAQQRGRGGLVGPYPHLLEQAFASLADEVGQIGEPRRGLRVRVVSGAPGHSGVGDIKPQDDGVFAPLPYPIARLARQVKEKQRRHLGHRGLAIRRVYASTRASGSVESGRPV